MSRCLATILSLTALSCPGCSKPAPSAAPGAPGISVAPPLPSTATPATQPSPTRSTSPSAAPPRALPGRIPCGKGSCQAGLEICCGHVPGEQGTCLPYAGDLSDIGAAGRACAAIDNERYPLICSDSLTCPEGQTCCMELGGDPEYYVCKPLGEDGWHACGGFESCSPDASCRSPGTSCSGGLCQLPRPEGSAIHVACGGQTCTGTKPVCCQPGESQKSVKPTCAAEPRRCPKGTLALECSGAADCAPHEYCLLDPQMQRPGWSTSCSQWFGGGNQPIACRTGADCPNVYGRPPKCEQNEDIPFVMTCT